MAHRLTVKGRVTIPENVREHLGIGPGSEVVFEIGPLGDVLVRKAVARVPGAPVHSPSGALRGTRKTGMSTDEIMSLLRAHDEDANDPGFR